MTEAAAKEVIDNMWKVARRLSSGDDEGDRAAARDLANAIDASIRAGLFGLNRPATEEARRLAHWLRWVHGLDVSP